MGVWQIIFTGWLLMGLGCYISKHGEPRTGTYNFWIALLGTAIQIGILYLGGFYNVGG